MKSAIVVNQLKLFSILRSTCLKACSVIVICFCLSQSDHIKQLLHYILTLKTKRYFCKLSVNCCSVNWSKDKEKFGWIDFILSRAKVDVLTTRSLFLFLSFFCLSFFLSFFFCCFWITRKDVIETLFGSQNSYIFYNLD